MNLKTRNEKRLIKIYQWEIKKPSKTIVIFIRCELFNPFVDRPPEELVPYFEIIPRIGIAINKGLKGIYLYLGWLNFYIKFHKVVFYYKREIQ